MASSSARRQNRRDAISLKRNVAVVPRVAGAVDHPCAANENIDAHRFVPLTVIPLPHTVNVAFSIYRPPTRRRAFRLPGGETASQIDGCHTAGVITRKEAP